MTAFSVFKILVFTLKQQLPHALKISSQNAPDKLKGLLT